MGHPAVLEIGFWFKVAAGPHFLPEEYVSISRIKNEATIPLERGGRPKDIFEMASNN
jgi:hypothetical protein